MSSQSPYVPFSLSVVPNRREVRLVAAGELDAVPAAQVAQAVEELRAAGFREIVLDLDRVDFIDSAGLRMLLVLDNDAKRNGHDLTLVPPAPAARRIFELTGTRGVFTWREPAGLRTA